MNLKYGSNNPNIDTVQITDPINMYKSRIGQISLRIVPVITPKSIVPLMMNNRTDDIFPIMEFGQNHDYYQNLLKRLCKADNISPRKPNSRTFRYKIQSTVIFISKWR